ncbi:GTPase ObgE [Mollicutes bacterium LVI A0039]|nr:GTPase ObgE [Mollicutes bacterium LVI A0039]
MFIDQVRIKVKGGDGGDGITAFRREKYVALGGPAGGSGGDGGNLIFEVEEGLRTLLDFSYNKKYSAPDGEKGRSKSQHGKNAEDLILKVPPGTSIYNDDTGELIYDLTHNHQQYIVGKGGRGGRGNVELARAGRAGLEIRENGEPAKEHNIRLELKLISDVGLVGMPSVGKSTIISVVSKAKPKIAAYHFTTLVPKLGVTKTTDNRSFVIADLPGLIAGASQGKGLGHQFLRHIERTKVILHVLDMGSFEGRDPIEDYEQINSELFAYNYNLEKKSQLVVANKMDLPMAEENLARFKEKYPDVEVVTISALTQSGLELMLTKTADMLDAAEDIVVEAEHVKVYKFMPEEDFYIRQDEDDVYIVTGERVEKLFLMTDFSTYDNQRRFANQLRKMGVDKALREAGVQSGDIVRIADYEFEFND